MTAPPAGRLRALDLLACLLPGALVLALAVSVPLRPQGGDAVPGRLGAAALACRGSLDLRAIDWLAERAQSASLPYYAVEGAAGSVRSTFGPGPAALGAAGMRSLRPGEVVDDRALQRRARRPAAAAVALSTALLALALRAGQGRLVSALGALVAGLSFAGAATLGQGLWQQTAALPWWIAAIAALAWGARDPRLLQTVPALTVVAALLRPPAAGIALGLLAGWAASGRARASALLAALAAAAPLLLANLAAYGELLPASQMSVNADLAPDGAVFRAAGALAGLAGLIASPGRGLLFFAPVVLLALAWGARRGGVARALSAGLLVQALIAGSFFKWWGGLTFGPRLLAEAAWIAAFLVYSQPLPARPARLLAGGLGLVTALVGLLGLLRYDASLWEVRRDPDRDPAALWDPVDSPLSALLDPRRQPEPLGDAPHGPFRYCQGDYALERLQPP